MKIYRQGFTPLFLFAALPWAGPQGKVTDSPWNVVELAPKDERSALMDMDGDGDEDLLRIDKAGFHLLLMDPNGRFSSSVHHLPWPSDRVAWNLSDLDADGRGEVLFYEDARHVVSYTASEQGFEAGMSVLTVRGDVPRGVYYMDFTRDVDGDGRIDIVLPEFGRYIIHLANEEGGYDEPFFVTMQAEVEARFANPKRLGDRLSHEVDIPWFTLEDIDGDGNRDLWAETDTRVFFHLANPKLEDQPTWQLDLEALERELPPAPEVEFEDLLRSAGRQVGWRLAQLGPNRPKDLIVQVGSKLRIYHGGSRTGPRGAPDQLLKSSGNVLVYFLRDVTGDGLADLQLLRGEGLSLGRLIRWLLLPGRLELQLYTYANDKGKLAKRPTRRNTIAFKIPRLLALMDEIQETQREIKEQSSTPARLWDRDGDGVREAIVDVREDKLYLFGEAPVSEDTRFLADLEEEMELTRVLEHFLLEDLDRRGDGATRTIDLGEAAEWEVSVGGTLREASLQMKPETIVPLAVSVRVTSLQVRDLNGDRRPDVIVIGRAEDKKRYVQVFVR